MPSRPIPSGRKGDISQRPEDSGSLRGADISYYNQEERALAAKALGLPFIEGSMIGDSMTNGFSAVLAIDPPTVIGWRSAVNSHVLHSREDIPLMWTGPQYSGYDVDFMVRNHFGANGQTLLNATAALPSIYGPGLLEPTLVVVMLGFNDIRSAGGGVFNARYLAFFAALQPLLPANAVAVVCFVPEDPSEPGIDAQIATANAALPGLWDTIEAGGFQLFRQASVFGLVLADMNTANGDALHPISPATYVNKMAPLIQVPLLAAVNHLLPP